METVAKPGKIIGTLFALLCIWGASANPAKAQLSPFGSMYFQNQYLGNPAMAGVEKGLSANLAYRHQWGNVPGAPETQSLTADYGSEKKIGLGLSFDSDKAGLIKRTRAMGTYAYHLPLNGDGRTLSFGLSLGVATERIDYSDINGNQGDAAIMQYNTRENYVDGDFGLAYRGSALTLQAAIPGLKSFVQKEQGTLGADRPTFMASASYKLFLEKALDGLSIEPKAMFRKISGYKDIFDAGADFTFANRSANIMVMYHSTQSATVGLGVSYRSRIQFMGLYTTETAALSTYANGNFEIGLRVKAF